MTLTPLTFMNAWLQKNLGRPVLAYLFFIALPGTVPAAMNQGDLERVQKNTITPPPEVLYQIHKTPPLPIEDVLIARLSKQSNADLSLLQFCSTALEQKQENYDQMIRQLYEEFMKFGSLMPGIHFLNYVKGMNNARAIFTYCLEHNAPTAAAETLFRLFRMEERGAVGSPPPNTNIWLTRAAEQGSASAHFALATKILEWSRRNRPEDIPPDLRPYIAVEAYHRNIRAAAESGNRQAQMMLARFYLDRFPLDEKNVEHINVAEGLRWLKILAEQTDAPREQSNALAKLGWLFLSGTLVSEKPPQGIIFNDVRRKPDEYIPNNTMEIAVDYEEALHWLLRIPEEHIRKYCLWAAGWSLAVIYGQGLGVPVDQEKAKHYQRLSNACVVY